MILNQSTGAEFCRPIKKTFDTDTGSIVADISKTDYEFTDHPIRYDHRLFEPKSELHITIVSGEDAVKLQKYLRQNPEGEKNVWGILEEVTFAFKKMNELYLIEEKPGVEAIIQMVEVNQLQDF